MAILRFLCAVLVWSLTFSSVQTLRIAWLVPGRKSTCKINIDTSIAAVKLALKSVSMNTGGNAVGIKLFETDCDTRSAMVSMLRLGSYDADVIIGPPCHAAMKTVGKLASYANLPVFSWYNPSIDFDVVKRYRTLIKLMPTVRILAKTLIHIMSQNGWKRFALIHESSELGTQIMEGVVHEVSTATKFRILSTHRSSDNMTDRYIKNTLRRVKKHATIIALACSDSIVRRVVLAADKVGMTNGQYVFIHLDYQVYTGVELRRDVLSDRAWKRSGVSDNSARRAYETLIHVVMDPTVDGNAISTRAIPSSKYKEFSRLAVAESDSIHPEWHLPSPTPLSDWTPDAYSMYLYDSILVWSVLTEVMNKTGVGYRNGRVMAHLAKNFNSTGTTGHVEFNNKMERLGKVFVLDMNRHGKFKPVQILRFNKADKYDVANLISTDDMFIWSSGKRGLPYQPSDSPMVTSRLKRPTVSRLKKNLSTKTITTGKRTPISMVKSNTRSSILPAKSSTLSGTATAQKPTTTTTLTTTTPKPTITTTRTPKTTTTQTTTTTTTTPEPTTTTQRLTTTTTPKPTTMTTVSTTTTTTTTQLATQKATTTTTLKPTTTTTPKPTTTAVSTTTTSTLKPPTTTATTTAKPSTASSPPIKNSASSRNLGQRKRKNKKESEQEMQESAKDYIMFLDLEMASLMEFQSILKDIIRKRQPQSDSLSSTAKQKEDNDSYTLPKSRKSNQVTDFNSNLRKTPNVYSNKHHLRNQDTPQTISQRPISGRIQYISKLQQRNDISQANIVRTTQARRENINNIKRFRKEHKKSLKTKPSMNRSRYNEIKRKDFFQNTTNRKKIRKGRKDKLARGRKPKLSQAGKKTMSIRSESLPKRLNHYKNKEQTNTGNRRTDKTSRMKDISNANTYSQQAAENQLHNRIQFPSQMPVADLWNLNKGTQDTTASHDSSLFPTDVLGNLDKGTKDTTASHGSSSFPTDVLGNLDKGTKDTTASHGSSLFPTDVLRNLDKGTKDTTASHDSSLFPTDVLGNLDKGTKDTTASHGSSLFPTDVLGNLDKGTKDTTASHGSSLFPTDVLGNLDKGTKDTTASHGSSSFPTDVLGNLDKGTKDTTASHGSSSFPTDVLRNLDKGTKDTTASHGSSLFPTDVLGNLDKGTKDTTASHGSSLFPTDVLGNLDKGTKDTTATHDSSLFPTDVLGKAEIPKLSEFQTVSKISFMSNYGIRDIANKEDSSAIKTLMNQSFGPTVYKAVTHVDKNDASRKNKNARLLQTTTTERTTKPPNTVTTTTAPTTTTRPTTPTTTFTRKSTSAKTVQSKSKDINVIIERLMKLEAFIKASFQKTSPAPTPHRDGRGLKLSGREPKGSGAQKRSSQILQKMESKKTSPKAQDTRSAETGFVWGSALRSMKNLKPVHVKDDGSTRSNVSQTFRKTLERLDIPKQKTISTAPTNSLQSTSAMDTVTVPTAKLQRPEKRQLFRLSRNRNRQVIVNANARRMHKLANSANNKRNKSVRVVTNNIGSAKVLQYKVRDRQAVIGELPKMKNMIQPSHIISRVPIQKVDMGRTATVLPLKDDNITVNKNSGNDSLANPMIDKFSAKVAERVTNQITKEILSASLNGQNKTQYAVHIVSDWIPSNIEEEPSKLKMTLHINKTQAGNKTSVSRKSNKTIKIDPLNVSRNPANGTVNYKDLSNTSKTKREEDDQQPVNSEKKTKPTILPEYKISVNNTVNLKDLSNTSKTKQEKDGQRAVKINQPVSSEKKGNGLKISLASLMSSWGFKAPPPNNIPNSVRPSRGMLAAMPSMPGMPPARMPPMPGMPSPAGMPPMPHMPSPGAMPQMLRMPPMPMMPPGYGRRQSSEAGDAEEARSSGPPSYGHPNMYQRPPPMYLPPFPQRPPVYQPPPRYRAQPPPPWHTQSRGYPPYMMQRGPPMWPGRPPRRRRRVD